MWCLTSPSVVVNRIRDDKSANTFRDLMDAYTGTVVCDALKTHEVGALGNPRDRWRNRGQLRAGHGRSPDAA